MLISLFTLAYSMHFDVPDRFSEAWESDSEEAKSFYVNLRLFLEEDLSSLKRLTLTNFPNFPSARKAICNLDLDVLRLVNCEFDYDPTFQVDVFSTVPRPQYPGLRINFSSWRTTTIKTGPLRDVWALLYHACTPSNPSKKRSILDLDLSEAVSLEHM
jgi:hypothetical protein